MGIIKNYRGIFELLPFSGIVSIGNFYYVDYNKISHPAAPHKDFEIVKILKLEDHSNFYLTDRGTRVKDYCILNEAKKINITHESSGS